MKEYLTSEQLREILTITNNHLMKANEGIKLLFDYVTDQEVVTK
jgi:hypothetical protein